MGDLATDIPNFMRRVLKPEGNNMPTSPAAQAPTPVTPAPRQKRNSAYCVILKVNIPVTDSASLVDAMKCAEEMSGADHWPHGSVVDFAGSVRKV